MKQVVYGVLLALLVLAGGCKSKQQEQAEAAVQEYVKLKAETGGMAYKPVSFESQPMQRKGTGGRILHGYEVVHEYLAMDTTGRNLSLQGDFFVDSIGNVSPVRN